MRTCVAAVCFLTTFWVVAEEPTLADLRREIDGLLKQISENTAAQRVEKRIEASGARNMVNNPVETKSGKLRIGGLVQVWAYSIQNDNTGVLDIDQSDPASGGSAARNAEADNDSFRVRRSEIRFDLDIHENISAHIAIDPAREATAYPAYSSNQGSANTGDHDVYFFDPCLCNGFIDDPRTIGSGAGSLNRLLQDAYVNYHGIVPYHDFVIGQTKRNLGEEGTRDSGRLNFAERAMITQPADLRDLGLKIHGNWLDGRIQYWAGIFNGAGTAFQQRANRSDDNDDKDFTFSFYATPLRKHEKFGTFELGYSILYGMGGEEGDHQPSANPFNGLNRRRTAHSMQYAWGAWQGAGPVSGWWIRGEWGQLRDRFAPSQSATGLDVVSTDPAPFGIQGWYVSTGFHFGRASCREKLWSALRNIEIAARYETMQNLFFHDLVNPERRFDVFDTEVLTIGVNYYISENVKLQLNYSIVDEEDGIDRDDRQFREVRNNVFLLNLQVGF